VAKTAIFTTEGNIKKVDKRASPSELTTFLAWSYGSSHEGKRYFMLDMIRQAFYPFVINAAL
jgi:hypothetical protein